jgi:uncharacterized protein (TIGR03067 family)
MNIQFAMALMLFALESARGQETVDANLAAKMTGNWLCVSATINGKPLSESAVKKLRLAITETRYKTERGDEVLFDSTYRLDATKTPVQINMVGTEGDLIGKEAQGIIAVEGDTLKICYTMPGKLRPVSFASATNSEAYLIIWNREKQ